MKLPIALLTLLVLGSNAVDDRNVVLSNSIVPQRYNLTFDIDFDTLTFNGYAEIDVKIFYGTKEIIFHAGDLEILNVILTTGLMEIMPNNKTKTPQTFKLAFKGFVTDGDHKIEVYYKGNISTDSWTNGLYAINYTDPYEYPIQAVVSQLDIMTARNIFPCFDEPGLKANFIININRSSEFISVSNMPLLKSVKLHDCGYLDTFQTIEEIPTHLVAFAIFNFPHVPYARGRIFIRPPYIRNSLHIINRIDDVIKALESYLYMSLPTEKLDMIVIGDLPKESLNNKGLLLLSEKTALYDEEMVNTRSEKQHAFLLIIRGVAHQWFGDVVTPSWWNYIWIPEGVATLLQYTIGNRILPHWRLVEQMALFSYRDAVEIDGFVTKAIPLKHPATTPPDNKHLINKIGRGKVVAVLWTVRNIVGEHIFQEGLTKFLAKHQRTPAISSDFWNAIQESNTPFEFYQHTNLYRNTTLTLAMEKWETLDGVAVVTVKRIHELGDHILFSQKRFVLEEAIKASSSDTRDIPVNWATQGRPNFEKLNPIMWFSGSKTVEQIGNLTSDQWIIVNKEASYYYLVNYDDKNWKMIAAALNSDYFGEIPPVTRGKLLYDAFMLARSGDLNYNIALDLIKYLPKENDYIVWNSFFYVFEFFYKMFSELEHFHYLQEFLAQALQPSLKRLGVQTNKTIDPDKDHINILHRELIIKWACLLGNKICRNSTTELLKGDFYSLSTDLKEEIICAGLRGAGPEIFTKIFEISQQTRDMVAERSLGCSENGTKLDAYLHFMHRKNISVFETIYKRGRFGVNYVLDFLKTHEIKEIIMNKSDIIEFSEYLTTEEQLEKLKNITPAANLNKALERVKSNIDWVKLHSKNITQWIKEELVGSATTVKVSLCTFIAVLVVSCFY